MVEHWAVCGAEDQTQHLCARLGKCSATELHLQPRFLYEFQILVLRGLCTLQIFPPNQ